jgi:hypothetical protein
MRAHGKRTSVSRSSQGFPWKTFWSDFQWETKHPLHAVLSPNLGPRPDIAGKSSAEHGGWSQVQYAFQPPTHGLALLGHSGLMLF